jgi:hypothetical protein
VTPFESADVAQVFATYPTHARRMLMAMRELVFETAEATAGVGRLEETLKWGEPAYLTSQSKSGSTVRIAWKKSAPQQVAVYFNCQTHLIETFRTLFPTRLRFEGQRAIVFDVSETLPSDALAFCLSVALTYHRNKASPPVRPRARWSPGP